MMKITDIEKRSLFSPYKDMVETIYKIHTLTPMNETPLSSSDMEDLICDKIKNYAGFGVKQVIFNPPATIVFWSDGSKTVAKCQEESWDAEKGLLMAIAKKYVPKKKLYSLLDSVVKYDTEKSKTFSLDDLEKAIDRVFNRKVKRHDTK